VKKIKEHEHKPWCTWCRQQGLEVPALWRQSRHGGTWACYDHQKDLQEREKKMAKEDSHMTEADYQTWGRL
jgi:hypothetical protein